MGSYHKVNMFLCREERKLIEYIPIQNRKEHVSGPADKEEYI